MKDKEKTKEQLTNELKELRQRISDLEASETERKQAEDAFKSERDKLQALMDGLARTEIGIDIVGIDYKILFQNQTLEERFGDLTGELCYEKYMGLEKPCDFCPMIESITNNRVESTELTGIDGRNYVLFSAPIPNPDGTVDTAIEVVLDTTERKEVEETLQKSEKRFRDIAENALEWIWEIDTDGKYTYASPVVEKILGFKPEEVLKKYFYDLFHPEDRQELKKAAFEVLAKKQPFREFINRNVHKDGKTVWLSTSGVPILDEKGHLLGYRGADIDISERRRAEEAMRESEEKYQSLVESTEDSIYLLDRKCRYLFMNKKHLSRLGLEAKKAKGRTYAEFHSEDETKDLIGKAEKLFETGKSLYYEHRSQRDGRYFLRTLSPVTETDGSTKSITVISKDINELKQADEALRESEERYRKLFEEAQDGIFLADSETGMIVDCNYEAAKLVGRDKSELIGQHQTILHPPNQGNRRFSETFQKHLGENEGQVLETQVITSTGEIKEVAIKANLLHVGDRKLMQGIFRDITDRKQKEEALRESEKKYRTILESIEEGYYEVDIAGNFTFVNDSMCEILGYSKDELIGMNNREYMDEENAKKVYETFNRVYKTGKPAKLRDYGVIEKDGTVRILETSLSLIKDNKGQPIGFRGLARDITERKQAEEALRDSEEKYRTILERIEEGYYEVDIAGNFTFVNDSGCKILGYPRDELLGMNNRQYMDEEDAKKVYQVFNRVLKTGIPSKVLDWELIRKDGTKRYAEISALLIKDSEGHPTGFRGILRDVTERKQAEDSLKESEERFRILVEGSPLGISLIGKDGRYKYINPKFVEMFGYTLKDIPTGRVWFRKSYPDEEYRHQVISTWKTDLENFKHGESRPQIFNVTCKDGSEKIIHFRPVTMETGDQFLIHEDITESKQAEAELIQTRNFLQNIFDSSTDGITTTDLQGIAIYTSPRAKDILGYEQNEIIGKKIYFLYGNGEEDAKTIMKELEEKSELRDHEMKLIRKDGKLIDINLSASLLMDEKGEVIGTLGIYRDITEKKKLEAQLQYSQRMEAIGTLAGGIAHNFNNLLMGMQGNVSLMLLDTNSDHPNYERLKNIEKMVQSGSKLTGQLLGYARGGRYEVRPISFNQLVKETSDTFDITKKDITVHQDLDKDLFGIIADQGQIEQVLLNLYVNAADAMPQGGDLFLKTINVTHKDMKDKPYEPKPGNYALLTVRDTGVGMDKKTMERIFEPFFTTKGLARGTGLGLASVYGIIKAHGGYIDVYSEKGQGTTFYVYLPATSAEPKELRAESTEQEEMALGKETILLVDDEEMILDVGSQLLEKLGYKVLVAGSGKEAIEFYKANKDKIDMVILDMIMPEMGGGETYDRMKKIEPKIKVLLSSGYSINGQATEILERGCSGFIQKPFSMEELSQSIRKVLDS